MQIFDTHAHLLSREFDADRPQVLREMQEKGMEIIYPDKQPFIDAAQPMLEKYRNDPLFKELITDIEQTK